MAGLGQGDHTDADILQLRRLPPPTHPPPPDVVGTYEGALYKRCDLYRPFPDCYMRGNQEFCLVCARAIRRRLQANLP